MTRTLFATVLVLSASPTGQCQTSFWTNATTPAIPEASDSAPVTLGLKFYSDVAGSVTGVRFYKGPHNTGTHIGNLWSGTGTKLAEVTFSGESASGWQQANFSAPVTITANTPYVVSYFAPNGRYPVTDSYSWSGVSAPPLHVSGSAPGVYDYGPTATFPSTGAIMRNYSVDVVFSSASTLRTFWTDATTPAIPEASDPAPLTLGLKFYSDVAGSVLGVRFYKGPHNTGTHIGNLWSGTGTKLAEVTFSAETASGWQQANFSTPVSIAANTPYVISYFAPNGRYPVTDSYSWSSVNAPPLHVSGSAPGVYDYGPMVTFPGTGAIMRNFSVDVVFSSADTSGTFSTFWTDATTPAIPEASDPVPLTLGLKFYSDVAGSVLGVRFYKGPHNTGTHIGNLWSGTGTKLAEVTFSGETASGWQQANFSTPVPIAANIPYVISYFAPNGRYPVTDSYPWSSVNAPPLHVSGSAPGVYDYGPMATFPGTGAIMRSFSVDVVFSAAGTSTQSNTSSITGNVSGSAATLTLSGAASGITTTSGFGNYSFSGLPNGHYVVAPSQPGFAFTPSVASVSINGTSVSGVNFGATAVPAVLPPSPHSVSLTWISSTSPDVIGYHLYRSSVSGGPYIRLTIYPVAATSSVDYGVRSGQTYFYVATSVDSNDNESTWSNEASAVVPVP